MRTPFLYNYKIKIDYNVFKKKIKFIKIRLYITDINFNNIINKFS